MTPIEQVIKAFEFCLHYYEQAYKEKWDYDKLMEQSMHTGLCMFYCENILNYPTFLMDLFIRSESYYKNLISNVGYLFRTPEKNDYLKPIKFRFNFLKEQIEILTKLQQKGYTHI